LAGERQRALVSVLALEHGNVVPLGRLLDVLWDSNAPATARTKLQGHVSALRRAICWSAQPFDDVSPDFLVTCGSGYMLRSEGVELDLQQFETLIAQARAAMKSDQLQAASELYASALGLWHGPAFADVELRGVRDMAWALDERRLFAVEKKAETDLALGRAEVVTAELSVWVTGHPLRERLFALLMLALYRLGCRADALRLYRIGRQAIVAELGLEPTSELCRLHRRILADDPALQGGAGLSNTCDRLNVLQAEQENARQQGS